MTKQVWQPIATAPKDGTEFLAYDRRVKKMAVCLWDPWNGCAFPAHPSGEYGHDKNYAGYRGEDITHWMALPEAPGGE